MNTLQDEHILPHLQSMTIKLLTAETPPGNYIHQTLISKIKALELKMERNTVAV